LEPRRVSVVEGRSLAECIDVVSRALNPWNAYYAKSAVESGVASFATLLIDGVPRGCSVFYTLDTDPIVGVVYYIAIDPPLWGRGLGKVLLASTEELLELRGSRLFVATTREDNVASRALFSSMNYAEKRLDELYAESPRAAENLVRALCSFEDDVVMYRGAGLKTLLKAFERCGRVCRDVWYRICYIPWARSRFF